MSDQSETPVHEGSVGPVGDLEVTAVPVPTSEDQIQVGQSVPGQPPKGFPTGPGIDMYGNPLTYGYGPNDVPPECHPDYVAET
jgi:hypothetical protein